MSSFWDKVSAEYEVSRNGQRYGDDDPRTKAAYDHELDVWDNGGSAPAWALGAASGGIVGTVQGIGDGAADLWHQWTD